MPTPARKAWMQAWEADLTPSPAAARSAARVEARTRSTRYYTREATARVPEPIEIDDLEELEDFEEVQALPELMVVTRRKPRWRLIIAALAFSGLLLGCTVVAPVLINAAATQVEASVGQLESQQTQLAAEASSLSAQISALSSPDRVAAQAGRLGLVPAQSVYYVETGSKVAATEDGSAVAGR